MSKSIDFTFNENNVEEMLNTPPLFDSQISKINEAFYEACYEVHVDPEIVEKQAELIEELKFWLNMMAERYTRCDFSAFVDLQEENMSLKKQISDIKKILGVDEL